MKEENSNVTLLLIDQQVSFHPGGSLAIPTANEDAKRLSEFLKNATDENGKSRIHNIVATMDSHHKLHIAHPSFWVDGSSGKNHPAPFTLISSEDIKNRKWVPRSDLNDMEKYVDESIFGSVPTREGGSFDLAGYCKEYAKRLEDGGRFQLCIWPEHCIIGSPGHCLVPEILSAVDSWVEASAKSVTWIHKGQNLLTEMYSAIQAEVPVDTSTSLNHNLIGLLRSSDKLIVCGQALSHCVNFTVRDIVKHCPIDERGKISILTDYISSSWI